jgi:hypothetical protein
MVGVALVRLAGAIPAVMRRKAGSHECADETENWGAVIKFAGIKPK